jgi:hypothetical protein
MCRLSVGNRTNGGALEGRWTGGPAMPSTEYFRRQSDICLRLSLIASDNDVASRLIVMAQEYKAQADALAAESKPSRAATAIIAHNGLHDGDTNERLARLVPPAVLIPRLLS